MVIKSKKIVVHVKAKAAGKPPEKKKKVTEYSCKMYIPDKHSECKPGTATIYTYEGCRGQPDWVAIDGGTDCLYGGCLIRIWNIGSEKVEYTIDGENGTVNPGDTVYKKVKCNKEYSIRVKLITAGESARPYRKYKEVIEW